jgi:hypothetical protein
MKRPIAMRCTREQFESIKDRLPYEIIEIDDFEEYNYLVNNYGYEDFKIGNTNFLADREIHETFNADIFLEACEEEVGKVWKGSEMQWKRGNGLWENCFLENEYRLKPQPNYSQEIEALQQKAKENGMKAVITFEKL